jgi:hypothetical protein
MGGRVRRCFRMFFKDSKTHRSCSTQILCLLFRSISNILENELLLDTRLSASRVPDGRIRRARAAVDRRGHRRVRLLRVLILDAVRLARQRGRRVGARLRGFETKGPIYRRVQRYASKKQVPRQGVCVFSRNIATTENIADN